MPRIGTIDPNKQQQVRPQDSFRYGTPDVSVSARPIDAYVTTQQFARQVAMPGLQAPTVRINYQDNSIVEQAERDARTLVGALNGLEGSIKAYGHYKKLESEDEKQEGYYKGARGDVLPDGASDSERYGYLVYQGEADAVRLESALNEAFAANAQTDTPEEWTKRVEEIRKPFVEGKAQAFLEGFVPKAVSAQHRYATQFNTVQIAKRQEEALYNFTVVFSKEFEAIINDNSIPAAKKNGVIRDIISTHQEAFKSMGIDRNDISKRALQVIGERAANEGKPGLLGFVDVPDKDGVTLGQTALFKEVGQYKREAQNRALAIESRNIALAERAERKHKEAVEASLVAKVISGGDISKDLADPSVSKALGARAFTFQEINKQRLDPNYHVKPDPVGFIDRSIKARQGLYSYDNVRDDVASGKLTDKEGIALINEIEQQKKYSDQINRPMQHEFDPYNVNTKRIKAELNPELSSPMLRNQTKAIQEEADREFKFKAYKEFQDNVNRNNGQYNPDDVEYRTNLDRMTEDLIKKMKPRVDNYNGEAKSALARLDSEDPATTKKRFSGLTAVEITKEFMYYSSFETAFMKYEMLEKAGAFKNDAQKKEVLNSLNRVFRGGN